MLLTEYVTEKWHVRNKRHFMERGYTFTAFGDTFQCKTTDLANGSVQPIEYQCEGCEEIIHAEYRAYARNKTHLCRECNAERTRERWDEQNGEYLKRQAVREQMRLQNK